MNKITLLFKGFYTYRNFPTWLAFKLRFYRNDERQRNIIFWNGLRFTARFDLSEPGTIDDVFLRNEYGIFRKAVPRGGVVIDIGANIGAFSVAAASAIPEVKIYSFEPSPGTFERFTQNVKLNHFESTIHPFNVAVAAEGGRKTLSEDPKNSGVASIVFGRNDSGILPGLVSNVVTAITLQDVFEHNEIEKCDFLKMDCEGAEYEIIVNAPKEILKKIGALSMEYHGDPTPIEDTLKEAGFEVTVHRMGPLIGILSAKQTA